MELSITQAIKYGVAWFYMLFMMFYVLPQLYGIFGVSLTILHYIILGLAMSGIFIYGSITGGDVRLTYILIAPIAYTISHFLLNSLFNFFNISQMWYTSEWWYNGMVLFLTEIIPLLIFIGVLLEAIYYYNEEQTLLKEIIPF